MTAGFPDAAARLVAATGRVGARALEIAIADDPTFRDRHDELALRRLLRDTEIYLDRLAQVARQRAIPSFAREWADQVAPVYRRRGGLDGRPGPAAEGLRLAVKRRPRAGRDGRRSIQAIDEAIASFRWYRRIAGDARKRNRLLAFLYKGA